MLLGRKLGVEAAFALVVERAEHTKVAQVTELIEGARRPCGISRATQVPGHAAHGVEAVLDIDALVVRNALKERERHGRVSLFGMPRHAQEIERRTRALSLFDH